VRVNATREDDEMGAPNHGELAAPVFTATLDGSSGVPSTASTLKDRTGARVDPPWV